MNTVSDEQILRFNQLAATWWDEHGPMWPLHKLNKVRVPYITQRAARHFDRDGETSLSGLRVLDIGCGAGLLSEAMTRHGATVTAVDPAARNIAIAQEHACAQSLHIDYREGTTDSVKGSQFDIVLNMEVVEHVDKLPQFMGDCCKLVAPAGMMFTATINRNLLAGLVAILGAEYILRWLPRGTHQYRRLVKPAELEAMLSAGGIRVSDRRGVRVNPFNRAYSLTDSTLVNYMLAGEKPG